MITVKRRDHKARPFTTRAGTPRTIPAHYECYYYWNGMEIAHYTSQDDTIYLRTDYLARPLSLPYTERMAKSKYPEMWAELTAFLKINEDTRLSEYTHA